jgi:hypothetical protein
MSKTSVRVYFEGLIKEVEAKSEHPAADAERISPVQDWYRSMLREILEGVDGNILLSEGEKAILDDALADLQDHYSADPVEIREWGLAVLQIATFIKLCA